MTPAVVFAEPEEGEIITVESTENIYSYDDASVSLFADNSNMTQCVDYIVSEMGKTVPAKTIDISSYKIDATQDNATALLNNVRYAVLYRHPEIFYLLNASANDSAQFSMSTYGGFINSIILAYTMSDDEIAQARKTIDAECDKIVSLTSDDMTELEKLLVVHDYIVANYEYDKTYKSRHLDTMVSQKTGVCEGYAYLLKYVLNKLNIDCVTVPSNAHQHMWNKVKLDGNWYNIDATHDDPIPNMSRNISHDHFLLTDTEIQQLYDNEHTSWEDLDYIEPATDTTYSSSILHGISGQIVYKDGNFYCIDDDNNICTIDFANNTLTPVYTNSSKFMWRPYGNASSRYIKTYTSLAFYDGDIYFNSADKIYMLDTNTYEAKEVYEYTAEKDVSNTYLLA
jgi:hypothetical protein